jgi:rhodanese-related sulfurtransferase
MPDRPLEISVSEAAEALRQPRPPLLLDCRTPEEFATASIAGAMLLPMQELPDRVGELAGRESEPIIVHCHHGMRSLRVTKWLRDRGFALAQSMAGGIDAWSDEVDPTVPKY